MYIRKIVALAIFTAIYIVSVRYNLEYYISIPVLVLAFSIIVAKITGSSPKELFNFQRSEKYFNKGGLRDLIRIPVVLFSFIQDILVWEIWGVYQVFVLFTDTVYFIKELIFWILHAVIWFLKQLLPFWRITYKMFLHYLVKWPWWIYRYAFRAIRKTYNWNVLKISLLGSFFTLLIFQLFYFLDITLEIRGLVYIGVILALLPLSWIFGEIASLRGQKLMFASFRDVRKQYRNGIESVRGILFFITFFVVLIIAEAGLGLLGWIPKAGIILMGFTLNVSFVINIILIFLAILIVFGAFVLPTYRLYNEFSETSLKSSYRLLSHIVKRSLQYISGFIPASFFATISSLPAIILVSIAVFLTLQLKENIIDIKIEKLIAAQNHATEQSAEYRLRKEINHLQYIQQFPAQILQEMGHRSLLKEELTGYENTKKELETELASYRDVANTTKTSLRDSINAEKQKPVINQTRINLLEEKYQLNSLELKQFESSNNSLVSNAKIDIEFASRKLTLLPFVFYLSGLFLVVATTLVFSIFFGYFGNFFYKTYLYRNDDTKAAWKIFIDDEKRIDKKQPLLSTTLNIIVIAIIAYFILRFFFGNLVGLMIF